MKEYFPKDELFEKLAAIEHERWADWQRYCHKTLRENLKEPVGGLQLDEVLSRWEFQINTPYNNLTEQEKDSDREQVMRYWYLIK
jgi:hypothetical protein